MKTVFPNGAIARVRVKVKDGETEMDMAEETAIAGEMVMEIAGEINNLFSY